MRNVLSTPVRQIVVADVPKRANLRPVKTPSERGAIGAWAFQARQELGLSVEQVADAMAARGQTVSPATLRGVEGGSKKPGARLLRTLQQVLDSAPPTAPAPVEGDVALAIREQAASNDRLAEAMQAQAESFTTLAASIDRAASGVVGTVGGFDNLLRGLLVALQAPASGSPDEAQSAGPRAPAGR